MGWFLHRKKKKKPARASKARGNPAAPKPWDPKRTLAAIKVLGVVTVVGLAVIVWQRGDEALRRYVNHSRAATVTPETVVLANAPVWMSEAVRMELTSAVAQRVAAQPLKNTLPAAVAELRRQPWVAGVERVERKAGGVIEVRADYRQPLAVVESRDGYHLVDGEGVGLPGLYTWEQAEKLGMPVVVGVQAAPPRTGMKWQGKELEAALSLIQLLAGEPYFQQIKAFNVSERDPRGRMRLVLHTESGMVRWGLPPGQEQSVEQDAATKVGWLRRLNQSRGAIDAGGKVVEIYGASIQLSQPGIHGSSATTSAPVLTTEYSW